MKLSGTWILAALLGWAPGLACAQLQLVPGPQPQAVFGGDARKINLLWHNAGSETANVGIQACISQTSSATVVQLAEVPWKNLQVLPQQTVVESARLDFPAVNAATKFLVQWIAETNHVLGGTEVLVYPTNLLGELNPLLDGSSLGVLDPNNEIKPLLKQDGVKFLDLEETTLEDSRGKLAIIGPFYSRSQMRKDLAQAVWKIAASGVAVVWLQPPPGPKAEFLPSFYLVPGGKAVIVIVQPELVAHFSENPESQLNLAYFCKLALNPGTYSIPCLAHQP